MDKLRGFIEKLKSIKHLPVILCIVTLIVVLIIYFSCVSRTDEKTSTTGLSGYFSADSSTDYCSSMRAQVESIVSQISGVGSASVVINWDRSAPSGFGGDTENPKAVSALVVCDGGTQTKVKLDVMYAVSTLLDLSIEKIMVYPKSI
ncbi:MAG: hypothetical protein HDT28_06910 [Clostridiales bacterium]|nr:hypothetical protein [Clostridiales bacterium]